MVWLNLLPAHVHPVTAMSLGGLSHNYPWSQCFSDQSKSLNPDFAWSNSTAGVSISNRSSWLTAHFWLKSQSGWWLGTFLFFYILGIIIPTDFHIFYRGGSTTNQIIIIINHIITIYIYILTIYYQYILTICIYIYILTIDINHILTVYYQPMGWGSRRGGGAWKLRHRWGPDDHRPRLSDRRWGFFETRRVWSQNLVCKQVLTWVINTQFGCGKT